MLAGLLMWLNHLIALVYCICPPPFLRKQPIDIAEEDVLILKAFQALKCVLTRYLCPQNLNILMLGAKDGKGGFFPEGIAGRINTPEGFDNLASGLDDWEGKQEAKQVGSAFAVQLLQGPLRFYHPLLSLAG